MPVQIRDPELFGITESSLTITFAVESDGESVDAETRVLLNGEERAVSSGVMGTRYIRVEELDPKTEYRVEIRAEGAAPALTDDFFPETVETLPGTDAGCTASFATLNDLHFGEPRFGGTLREDGDYGDPKPGFDAVRADDQAEPYWRVMNEDAISEINASGPDAVFIKGDIADRGREEQFKTAARAFERFEMPHHAFLGNHDYYALQDDVEVDGLALLNQPSAPRVVDLGGWRIVLADTVEPGQHHGVFPDSRLAWLDEILSETRELKIPTLVLMHHQPVPPKYASVFPNKIGLRPEHSLRLFDLIGRHPQVKALLIGHTHMNRARIHPAAGAAPFIEVSCVKDYPGSFGHYRLYDDGHLRQEVRRISTPRALAHSTRCRDFFNGAYRKFALGQLSDRSLIIR